MPDISDSVPAGLPSTRRLIRSTMIAAIIASVLLVAVVLPAEYGIDPTRIGGLLGLTEMGRIKVSLAREAQAEAAEPVAGPTPPTLPATSAAMPTPPTLPATSAAMPRSDVATVTLGPDEGREIKLSMRDGARVTYTWSTDRGVVNHDMHADSKEPPRDYHGYKKGTGVATDEGVLVAAFDGWHGWYWRNRGDDTLTVTLHSTGDYQDIKEMD